MGVEKLRLKDKHTWKSKPGYSICVLDRGAIRFDYPIDWNVSADEDSLKVRDKPEPDDNCVLAVSHMHLPPEPADREPGALAAPTDLTVTPVPAADPAIWADRDQR